MLLGRRALFGGFQPVCVLSRGLRTRSNDNRIRDTHSYVEPEPYAGLEVSNDEPDSKPQPLSTRELFLNKDIPLNFRHTYETFRFPVVAKDPALAPPDYMAWEKHHLPRDDYFPSSPEEAHLDVLQYLKCRDMWLRRKTLAVPYFTVGSYVAVTASDPNQPQGVMRFVGMCLQIRYRGLGTNFRVANVIDTMPVCKHYELYGPYLQKIEVLKLQRKKEDMFSYFRKLDPAHYKVPEDMTAEDPDRDPHDMTIPPKIKAVRFHQRKKFNLS